MRRENFSPYEILRGNIGSYELYLRPALLENNLQGARGVILDILSRGVPVLEEEGDSLKPGVGIRWELALKDLRGILEHGSRRGYIRMVLPLIDRNFNEAEIIVGKDKYLQLGKKGARI